VSTFAASYDTVGWIYRLGTSPLPNTPVTDELSMRVDLGGSLSIWATLDGTIAEVTVAERAPGQIDRATLEALAALLGQVAIAELIAAAAQPVALRAQQEFLELPDVVTSAAADRQQALLAASVWRRSPVAGLDTRLVAVFPSSPRLLPVQWSAAPAERALHVDALRRGSGEVLETAPAIDAGGGLVRAGRVWLPVADDLPVALDTTRPAQLAWQTVTGELLVRLPKRSGSGGFEPGLWVRVNDHQTGVPVALAPVTPDGDASALLATADGTLAGLYVDLGREAAAGAGTADERFLQRIGALIDLALDAVDRGDTPLAAIAWQAAADVADQHDEHHLAAELRDRAERAAAQAPPATGAPPREAPDTSPASPSPPSEQRRRRRRAALLVAVAVGLVVAVVIWLLSGSSDDRSAPRPASVPSTATTTPPDVVPATTATAAPSSSVDSTTTTAAVTTTFVPPLVDEAKYRWLTPGTSLFSSERFYLVQLVTGRISPGEPLVITAQFGKNFGEQSNANLEECLAKENMLLGNFPSTERFQMPADFRIARVTDPGALSLGNYQNNLVVPWQQVQATDAPFSVAPFQWQPFRCEQRGSTFDPNAVGIWNYVRLFYDIVQVSIPLPALEPGTYTLVPVFVEGPPADSTPGVVTFIVE